MSNQSERRSSVESRSGLHLSKDRPARTPSLLPSALLTESPISPGREGYEGERLHEMLHSAQDFSPNQDQAPVEGNESAEVEAERDAVPSDGPSKFDPFFTVIEDSATGAQYHPYVHYVFSDDDPDVITNAMFSALDPKSQGSSGGQQTKDESITSMNSGKERYLIVDVGPTGESIASARSLAPEWQIIGHSLTTAPTFEESSVPGDAGLMLRIEGHEGPKGELQQESLQQRKGATNEELLQSMNRLASQFQGELDALRKLTASNFHPGHFVSGDLS